MPYSSAGGDTLNSILSVDITASNIVYTAPTNLLVAPNLARTINAALYVTDGPYTISCGDATNLSTNLTSVTRAADTCNFTITSTGTQGPASFTIAYTSTGGHILNAEVPLTVGPDSDIVFAVSERVIVEYWSR